MQKLKEKKFDFRTDLINKQLIFVFIIFRT